MSIVKKIIDKLTGKESNFSDLEKLILNHVRDKLPVEKVQLWDQQIDMINKIQRLPGGVEVNFYRMEKGEPTFTQEIAFQGTPGEWLMAEVSVRVQDAEPVLKAQIWFVSGFLFSIEYQGGASYFEELLAETNPNLTIDVNLN